MNIRMKQLQQSKYQREGRNYRFDQELVRNTGIETFNRTLFESLLSTEEAKNPTIGLKNLRLLACDELGEDRATVAGVLLCTDSPHNWLPHARIEAIHYRGKDRDSAQLDSQTIVGPLYLQIIDAVNLSSETCRLQLVRLQLGSICPNIVRKPCLKRLLTQLLTVTTPSPTLRFEFLCLKIDSKLNRQGRYPKD